MFENAKKGDLVYVVFQLQRYVKEPCRQKGTFRIEKVGRKYGYFLKKGWEYKFHLDSGQSAHGEDCNARANGCGFDVYPSELEYEEALKQADGRKRLKGYLNSFARNYPPEMVTQLLSIFDAWDRGEL